MRYEPNPKHKPVPTPGRRGSICPRDVDAEELLNVSVPAQRGGKRFTTDGIRAYCAQRHDSERDLWHGYPVGWDEVPPAIVSGWIAAGTVSARSIKAERRRGR